MILVTYCITMIQQQSTNYYEFLTCVANLGIVRKLKGSI